MKPSPATECAVLPIGAVPNTQGLNSKTFHVPPLDGSVSFVELHDWHYHNSPKHPVFSYADPESNHVREILWEELVPAIHRAGKYVSSLFTFQVPIIAEEDAPVVAIFAISDSFTYCTTNLGIARTGAISFAISPRNSPAAVASLLKETKTKFILIGREPGLQGVVTQALQILRVSGDLAPDTGLMPVFDDLFLPVGQEKDGPTFLPALTGTDVRRLCFIVHSSGSTAFPKPIYWSHYGLILMGRFPFFGELDLADLRFSFHCIPMFHGLGSIAINWPATCGMVVNAFAPNLKAGPPNPNGVFEGMAATKSNIALAVPAFIEAWSEVSEKVEHLKSLAALYFGGGPLTKSVGDFLFSQGVQVLPMYAGSETSLVSKLRGSSDVDWEYFQISPHVKSHWINDDNGASELVIIPNPDHLPAVLNTKVGDSPAYATSDLLIPHPTRAGLWRVFGRADDQIIHSTGEKTNPGPLEAIMNRDPQILASVMFGRGQFNPGVIIHSRESIDPSDLEKVIEYRNQIWPTIEKANTFAPQHSRIFKEMILFTAPSKPFQYTAKGTARRGAIINDYEEEIANLYALLEEVTTGIAPPSEWTRETLLEYVRAVVKSIMKKEVGDRDDLFQWGCDSLQATWIRNILLSGLRRSTQANIRTVSGSFVYEHPSVESLTEFILGIVSPNSDKVTKQSKVEEMTSTVKKFTQDFAVHQADAKLAQTSDLTVFITGTTGAIGASVLAEFAVLPGVVRIYAFNREGSRPLVERQREALETRALDTDFLDSTKVVLLEGDLIKPNFGLGEYVYHQIRTTITHIVHVAWPVDFNIHLRSFEPHLQGVRSLVDLAISSPLPSPPRFLFTSSISVLRQYPETKLVPEVPVAPDVAAGSGYGESKWVAETILLLAGRQTVLRPVVIRVGQVSGGQNGCWNPAEWIPSIVQTASLVKCLPSLDQDISLIPLDLVAKSILELRDSSAGTVHLTHPKPMSWNTIFSYVGKTLNVPLLPYSEWLSRLQAAETRESIGKHPALRLLEFFKTFDPESGLEAGGLPRLALDEALKESPSLGLASELGEQDVKRWLDYWKSVGVIDL